MAMTRAQQPAGPADPKTAVSRALEAAFRDLAAGLLNKAGAACRRVIAAHPRHGPAHHLLGMVEARRGEFVKARHHLRRAIELDPDDADALNTLGNVLRETKDDAGAIAAYERAAALRPGQPGPLRNLGNALAALGRPAEAAPILARAQRAEADAAPARPPDENPGPAPAARAPDQFLRALFDDYAATFDRHLVKRLNYRAPEQLAGAVGRVLGPGPFDVFDAGCGTGLLGAALRPVARRLVGSDLSANMAAEARRRGVYDTVLEGDLVAQLNESPAGYDLVAMTDVLIYFGDLAPVFAAASVALRPEGALAFSVERAGQGDWHPAGANRYRHSEAYLRRMADAAGMIVALIEAASPRDEGDGPVPGLLFVARRAAR